MEEIWKPLLDNPRYMASNMGNVKNKKTGRILKQSLHSGLKIPYLHLYQKPKAKNQFTSVIIWEAFNGKKPEKSEIHHIDFNKLNNKLENLECLTPSQHRQKHRLQKRKTSTKLNEEEIHILLYDNRSVRQLERIFKKRIASKKALINAKYVQKRIAQTA